MNSITNTENASIYTSAHMQVHIQQDFFSSFCQMFQKLVLPLVLIGTLGPLLFAEGQEFGG